MRLRPEQLDHHLSKKLAPLYLVFGGEPLLVQEAADSIRKAVKDQGYSERQCLTVEAGFDWNILSVSANSLSLFANRRLLELRLGSAKPGDPGAKALTAYAQRLPEDAILLVICDKLDVSTQKSRWFTALESVGVVIQIWPVGGRQLPAWIERRMRGKGLRPTPEAVALLAQRVEGNLLAADQEIEKLYILLGGGAITETQLLTTVGDSSRYSVYDLVDAALAGQAARAVRIINGLRGEAVDAVLVSWALHREVRLLALLSFDLSQRLALEAALTRHKVWEKRKPLLRSALRRLNSSACRRLLRRCARADRIIKGVEVGNPWDELLQISLGLAGLETLAETNTD